MKKILKNLSILILSFLLVFSNLSELKAASASISVSSSSSSVVVGNTFTVTIKVSSSSALGSWEFTPSYDSSKFKMTSGESTVADVGDGKTKSKSYTYKFKAIGTGSGKITVKSYGVLDYDTMDKMSVSAGSKTVKVVSQSEKQASYSKNNDLKDLSVDGLKLNPSFNKNTTEYTVEASPNTTSVQINATKDDSKASVSGDGKHDVNEGENKFSIKVTAQNGSTKTYNINVKVVDPNPIEITIEEKKYVVVKRESNLKAPNDFEKTTVDINEQKVPGFYNELNNYTLIGLKDEEGNIALFNYDKENNTFSKYENVNLDTLSIIPLSITNNFSDAYKKTSVLINGVLFESYKKNTLPFHIIYARNFKTGKNEYYQYDEETNSIIRYVKEKEDTTLKDKVKNYEKIIMILLAETVIIVFVLICILFSKLRKNKKRKQYLDKKIKETKETTSKEQKQDVVIEKEDKEIDKEINKDTNEKDENDNNKEVLKDEKSKKAKHKRK